MFGLQLPRRNSTGAASWWRLVDWWLVAATFGLLAFGLVMLASSSLGSSQSFFSNQILFAIVGSCLYIAISRLDYRVLLTWSMVGYVVIMGLLLLVVGLGQTSHGAESWLRLGSFSLQPSEFAKLVLIVVYAWIATWCRGQSRPAWQMVGIWTLLLLPPFGLTLIQPDLGTASVMMIIWLVSIWMSPISKRWLGALLAGFVVILAIGWMSLAPYQQQRVTTFLNPGDQPLGAGYNVLQSQIAVGSGMWLGKGWGRGTQSHLNFLPEHHSDFIFASLSEELGLAGSGMIVLLYGIILWRGSRLAWQATDQETIVLVIGVVAMVLFQAVINIGMNVGIAPITGIPLPLVSYGGSSLLMTMMALALLQSVARQQAQQQRLAQLAN